MITIHADVNYNNHKVLADKLTSMTPGYNPAENLAVTTSFLTIQGEAPFAGMPAVFLRLAGCNRGSKVGVGCPFCFPSHLSTAAYEYMLPLGDPEATEQQPVSVTKLLNQLVVGDGLPSYAELPTIDILPTPIVTKISAITHRMVPRDQLVLLVLQSSLDDSETQLVVTKEHPFFVHERIELPEATAESSLEILPSEISGDPDAPIEGSVGAAVTTTDAEFTTVPRDFIEAAKLRPGKDVLQGAELSGLHAGQNNILYINEVRELDEEEFQALIDDQVAAGAIDEFSETYSRDGISVTSVTCETVPTYLFRGVYVHNCDTYFAVGETTRIMSLDDVVAEVVEKAKPAERPILVITGGEPMLQAPALQSFLYKIAVEEVFEAIQFETNGDLFGSLPAKELFGVADELCEEYDDEDSDMEYVNFVISPKRTIKEPKSGAFIDRAPLHGFFLRLVISGDPESPYYTVPQFLLDLWPKNEFYLSPLTEYSSMPKDNEIADIRTDIDIEATRRNVSRANKLATEFGLRVSFQAHSYIGFA